MFKGILQYQKSSKKNNGKYNVMSISKKPPSKELSLSHPLAKQNKNYF